MESEECQIGAGCMRHSCRRDAGRMLFNFFFIFKSKYYVRTLWVGLRVDSPKKVITATDRGRTASRPNAERTYSQEQSGRQGDGRPGSEMGSRSRSHGQFGWSHACADLGVDRF